MHLFTEINFNRKFSNHLFILGIYTFNKWLTFLSGLAISGKTAQKGLTNSRNLTEKKPKIIILKINY